ncbi:MAG TPA: hypothetical protein ENJ45_00785, partial [Phaeodactylibacter sp.]|nr:hypothetical protein [Phaeodactylibacter sp.]
YCRQMLNLDPCLEDVHIRIMQSFLALNMRDQAIKQFQKCKIILQEELDMEPSKKLIDFVHSLS